jgi:glycosyltransferase involved in cell wall biosynthesis
MQDVSISICVPAFNEEKTLAAAVEDLVDTLSVLVREIEVIIVNDGSSDSTLAIAEGLASKNPQIKVINHKNNLGVGVSFRDALAKAKYKFFTWFPGDHENSA